MGTPGRIRSPGLSSNRRSGRGSPELRQGCSLNMKAGSTRGHPRRAAVVASPVSVHAHVLTSHLLQHGQELRFLRCVIKPRSALNAEGDPRRCLNTTGLDHQLISTVEVSPIFEEPADGFVEGIHAIHLWVSKDRTDLVT